MTRFILNREILLKPLQSIFSIADKKHTDLILRTVLCKVLYNKLILTAFDSEIEIIATIKLPSPTKNNCFTMPARKIVEIIRSLPNEAEIKITQEEGHCIFIRSGLSKFNLFSLDPKLFPTLNTDTMQLKFKLPLISLFQSIKRVQFAMAKNDFRYCLNGMLWEIKGNEFKTVASDGRRIESSTIFFENMSLDCLQIIIPRKAILEFQKIITDGDDTVVVEVGKNYFKIVLSHCHFVSRLVDDNYPDYNNAIPKNNNTKHLVANLNELRKALLRISILSNTEYRTVKPRLEKNDLLLTANNPENEKSEDQIAVKYNEEVIEVGYNIDYLIEALNFINDKTIDLYFDNTSMALLLKYKTDNNICVVSPIRL